MIYTTNAIEALNRQLRKAIKTKGNFPNEDAARKLIYLAAPERRPAMDPNPELDGSATRVQNPLRRPRPRHRKLTVTLDTHGVTVTLNQEPAYTVNLTPSTQ